MPTITRQFSLSLLAACRGTCALCFHLLLTVVQDNRWLPRLLWAPCCNPSVFPFHSKFRRPSPVLSMFLLLCFLSLVRHGLSKSVGIRAVPSARVVQVCRHCAKHVSFFFSPVKCCYSSHCVDFE